jgi:hypothetical protein
MEGVSRPRLALFAPAARKTRDDGKGREADMRKLLTFAGLLLAGSVVGCYHTDTGCSSCGCGGSGGYAGHHPCTVGVCDCEIPPIPPYGHGYGGSPAPASATLTSAEALHDTAHAVAEAPAK